MPCMADGGSSHNALRFLIGNEREARRAKQLVDGALTFGDKLASWVDDGSSPPGATR